MDRKIILIVSAIPIEVISIAFEEEKLKKEKWVILKVFEDELASKRKSYFLPPA